MKLQMYVVLICMCCLFGCKKNADIDIPCQNKIDLGEILLSEETDRVFHYPDFVSRYLFNANQEDSIRITINLPSGLEEHIKIYNRSSDCENTLVDNEYIYAVEEKLVNIKFYVDGLGTAIVFFRMTSVFKEEENSFEKTNEVLLFYAGQDFYWTDKQYWLNEDPLATIFLSETAEDVNDVSAFYPEIELNGNIYENVYVASNLDGVQYLSKIYFSLEEGFIGIDNKDGETWISN